MYNIYMYIHTYMYVYNSRINIFYEYLIHVKEHSTIFENRLIF